MEKKLFIISILVIVMLSLKTHFLITELYFLLFLLFNKNDNIHKNEVQQIRWSDEYI